MLDFPGQINWILHGHQILCLTSMASDLALAWTPDFMITAQAKSSVSGMDTRFYAWLFRPGDLALVRTQNSITCSSDLCVWHGHQMLCLAIWARWSGSGTDTRWTPDHYESYWFHFNRCNTFSCFWNLFFARIQLSSQFAGSEHYFYDSRLSNWHNYFSNK